MEDVERHMEELYATLEDHDEKIKTVNNHNKNHPLIQNKTIKQKSSSSSSDESDENEKLKRKERQCKKRFKRRVVSSSDEDSSSSSGSSSSDEEQEENDVLVERPKEEIVTTDEKVVPQKKKARQGRKGLSSFRTFSLSPEYPNYSSLIKHLFQKRKLISIKMTNPASRRLLGNRYIDTLSDEPIAVYGMLSDGSIVSLLEESFFDNCMFGRGGPGKGKKHVFKDIHNKYTFECEMDKGTLKVSIKDTF